MYVFFADTYRIEVRLTFTSKQFVFPLRSTGSLGLIHAHRVFLANLYCDVESGLLFYSDYCGLALECFQLRRVLPIVST